VWFYLIAFVFTANQLPAQTTEVVFLEGTAEEKTATGWHRLETGDFLAIDTVFRVGANTILELTGDLHSLTISSSGIFSLKEILKDHGVRSSDKRLGRFLSNALKAILAGKMKEPEVVVFGARAQEAKDAELTWLDVEEENLRKGRTLLRAEKYEQALHHFQKANAEAFGDEADHYQFFVCYCYALMGKKALALQTLNAMMPDKSVSFYDDWILVRGQLFYESMAYRRSLDLFEQYIALYPAGSKRQSAHLFSGLCHRELGDKKAACSEFEKAYQADPDSEMGEMAKGRF